MYNGYQSEKEFREAMSDFWNNPESEYQKYLYSHAMKRHAKGLPVSWDYIAAPMPSGVVSAGSYVQIYGDIIGGSGE